MAARMTTRLPHSVAARLFQHEMGASRRVAPDVARLIIATNTSNHVPYATQRMMKSTMAAVVDTMEPRMARPPVLSTSTPAAAPLPADHLLPEGLFDGPLPSSVNAQKLLGMSSAYLCHSLLDINTNGYVTPCELQHGLATIGLDLTDEQMDMLVERYDDAPRNGLFERNELLPLFDHLKLHCVVGSQKKVLRGAQRHLFFTKIGAVAGGRSIDDVKTEHELVKKLSTTCPQYLSYSLFDTNSNGFITGEELKSGLQALAKIEVTDEQINKLVEKYDDNKNGVLEPCEVIPMFDDITKYKSISALLNASEYERVYGACAKYLTYAAFEKDDEGFITPRELKSGLKELGKRLESEGLRFDLSDEEINVIVQKYDDNNNNVLEPEEVAEFIDDFFAADCSIDHVLATPRAVSSTEIIPWQVNHKLLTYSSEYLTHSLMDSNTNGYITGCELQSGLRALGVRMSDEQFEILAARYDDNRNGVFEREEIEPLFDDLKVHVLLCGYP